MSIANFKKELAAGLILKALDKSHVYAKGFNRDYDKTIKLKKGASVEIDSVGDPTISDYDDDTTTLSYERLQGAGQKLVVEKQKSFAFQMTDVEKAQSDPDVWPEAMRRSGYKLNDAVDIYCGGVLAAAVPSANTITRNSVGTTDDDDNAFETLVRLRRLLGDNLVSDGETVTAVISHWFLEKLVLDERFSGFGTAGSMEVIRGKPIKQVRGMDIYVSNNCPTTGSATQIFAWAKMGATYAEQLDQVKALDLESKHAEAVRGLQLYGAKITRASVVAVANCIEAS